MKHLPASLLRRAVLFLATLGFTCAAHAGTFSTAPWTNDASTGIALGRTVWAYHFGATTATNFNGIPTSGIAGPNASNANFDLTGMTSVFNADTNNVTGLGSAVMAHDFVYGGNPASVTVKNLTVGKNYVVSFFSVGWTGDPDADFRYLSFGSGTDGLFVRQSEFGSDNGIRIDYAFTATAATRLITIALSNPNNASFHLYGLSLQAPPFVSNTNDSGAGSLRQALADSAGLFGPDTITFSPTLDGATITLASEIVFDDPSSATIDASSLPAGVTIDGGPGTNRIFTVSSGTNLSMLGLKLTGGNGGGALQVGNGNAIVNFGTVALTRCTLSGNTRSSGLGGAILNDGGTLTLSQCTLSGNSTSNGGAISQTTGTTTLTQSTLSGNSAIVGGAIYNQGGALTLLHCTLFGNSAEGDGGAISKHFGTLTLTHCTLSGNSASFGGAIFDATNETTLTNSIVAGNTARSGGPDIHTLAVTITPTGVNFIGDPAGAVFIAGTAILTTAANGPINLAPLVSNGGPTQTMLPLAGSPAIDAAVGSTALRDQRGVAILGVPDIGAVENGSRVTVAIDQLDTPAGAQVSLREAVRDCPEGGVVDFAAALSGQPLSLASEITPAQASLRIDGSNLPAGATIDGGADINRIFTVNSGKSLALLGLKLTGGNGGGTLQNGNGGAIVNFGTLALTRCTLTGNTRSSGSGGAILNDGGTLTATQCTFSGNSTTNGGAIFQTTGMLTLGQCTFTGNSAINGGGGAISNQSGNATLTHCTLAGNQATGGGAIELRNGTLSLTHCTLTGNTAVSSGGGANIFGGTMTLENSIVSGNTLGAFGPGRDIFNDINATLTRSGANLVGVVSAFGTLNGPGTISTADPLLAPLGNYGGPTKTFALLPGSPARNAAVGSLATSDQRGFPIVGGTPDIGAYEAGNQLANIFNAYIWETLPTAGNGTITDPLHAQAFDFDGDGVTNGNEWLALTDAANPSNYFRVTQVALSGSQILLTFPTVVGRTYSFESNPDLAPGNWTPLGLTRSGDGNIQTISFGPITGQSQHYFRIRVGP